MKNLKFKLDIQFFADDADPTQKPAEPNQPAEPPANPEQTNPADAYAEALEELRRTSVSREEYEKILTERNNLIKLTAEHRDPHRPAPEEPVNLEETRKNVLSERLTNYDYISNVMKLRKGIMESGGRDPFVSPDSDHYEEDVKAAEKVAKLLEETLDFCKDKPELFSAVLTSRLYDSEQIKLALAKKKAKS